VTAGTAPEPRTGDGRFTVKWLAAAHDAEVRARITGGLAARGHDPSVLEYSSVAALSAGMGRDRTRILAASSEMAGDPAFEAAIREIARGYPLDVLCYGPPLAEPARSRLAASSTVRMSPAADPSGDILEMAEQSPRWQSPRFIRGLVISRALDLEGAIDDCIIRRLSLGRPMPEGEALDKCHKVLYSRNISMAQRWSFLRLIMTIDGAVDGDLLRLIESVSEARNRLAHARLDIDESGTVVSGHKIHAEDGRYRFDADMLWETVCNADEAILRLGGMVACMDAHGA